MKYRKVSLELTFSLITLAGGCSPCLDKPERSPPIHFAF
jgi:hypothetical protein